METAREITDIFPWQSRMRPGEPGMQAVLRPMRAKTQQLRELRSPVRLGVHGLQPR